MNRVKNTRRSALKAKGYLGREDDMLLAWAKDNGAESNELQKALIELLHLNGATSHELNAAWTEVFKNLGLTGSREEMEDSFWDCEVFNFPLRPSGGWTGKEFCSDE